MDWSNPAGAAVSGGFGLLGSYLSYKYNQRLQEQQNQYNLDMWRLQNEYNSPQAQMQRFEDAGLNPNLIYGQGTSGNATHAPEMGVASAPDLSPDMRALGEAFNIEGLKTAIANRKKAQAEATLSQVAAADAKDSREAQYDISVKYGIDPATGLYKFEPGAVSTERSASFAQRRLKSATGAISTRAYHFNKLLLDNFRTNSLLAPRANLIGSTIGLNTKRGQYLTPQIQIGNYSARYAPWTFWTGIGTNIFGTAAKFIP